MGNPAFPGRTFSNGRNWIDFLTYTYNASFISTYNFAFGGAVVDGSVTPSGFRPMKQQVQQFFMPVYSSANGTNTQWESNNSLFLSFFGINDVTGTYKLSNKTVNAAIFASYSSLVEQLYQAGARNFLFVNIPAVHRSPLTMNQGDTSARFVDMQRSTIADFNMRLLNMAAGLVQQHGDATVFVYDSFTLFNDVLDRPNSRDETTSYTNTTGFCPAYSK